MVKENNVEIDLGLQQETTQQTAEEGADVRPQETPDDGADQGSTAAAELEALHKKITAVEQEKEEYLQSYLRLRADFDNYKRRTRQELLQAANSGKEELLLQLLPVLDNLERALQTAGEPDKWRSGVEMIFRQFLEVLLEAGLKPITAVGEAFDPNLHEALLREPSEQPENTVLEEIKKGYLFGEKTLRPSLVKVAAAPESADTTEEG